MSQKKTSDGNFIRCMQASLKRHYDTKPIGLGGVFVLMNGNARIHVMVCTVSSSSAINSAVVYIAIYAASVTVVGFFMFTKKT